MGQPLPLIERKPRLTERRRRRLAKRDEALDEPLPAPFEHLDGHWWIQVVQDYDKAVEAMGGRQNDGSGDT